MSKEAKKELVKEPKIEEEKTEELKQHSPLILCIDLHCLGCAKKIERTISKIRGVDRVMIDMEQNQVTISGVIEPQAVCASIVKETKRTAKVFSPLPQADEPIPGVVASQVNRLTTVELIVNMHCEACAKQLKRKILKMRGSIDANKLVDYVYRRTKKQAKIVLQHEPRKHKEEQNPDEEAKKLEERNKASGGEETINKMMYYCQPLHVIERIPPPQLFSDENPNACCIT